MMNLRITITLLLGILLSYNTFAQIDHEALYQRWQAVTIEDSRFDESKKELSADLKSQKEALEISTGLLSLEFLKNGTVIFHSYPESDVATYIFSKKNNRLRIYEEIGRKADVFTVSKLDKNEMVLIQQNKKKKVTLIFKTYDAELDQNKAQNAYNKLNEFYGVEEEINKVK
ncbi:MAG TPA: hypothetical protein VFD78_05695 [Chitinophagaceae bacterium]|nr:hypothetical protein [Chitinophagaceae bacterium]